MVDTGFLKGRRVMAGKSQMAMAVALGVSLQTYMNKENGKFEFKDSEKIKVSNILSFSLSDFNRAFYSGNLPK